MHQPVVESVNTDDLPILNSNHESIDTEPTINCPINDSVIDFTESVPCNFSDYLIYLQNFRVEQCPLFLQHKCNQHRPYTCFSWHFMNQRRRQPSMEFCWSSNSSDEIFGHRSQPILPNQSAQSKYNPDVYCDEYDEQTGICPKGDACSFVHRNAGDTERRYHPRYYKAVWCYHSTNNDGFCTQNGQHCYMAHSRAELSPLAISWRSFLLTDAGKLPSLQLEQMQNTLLQDRMYNDQECWNEFQYVLEHYKTTVCNRPVRICRQGFACPHYHNPRDRRRNPFRYNYRSTPCPMVRQMDEWQEPCMCDKRDLCQLCHSRTEQQFHPDIYKSTRCHDILSLLFCPRGNFCAFAHSEAELKCNRPRSLASSLTQLDNCSTHGSTCSDDHETRSLSMTDLFQASLRNQAQYKSPFHSAKLVFNPFAAAIFQDFSSQHEQPMQLHQSLANIGTIRMGRSIFNLQTLPQFVLAHIPGQLPNEHLAGRAIAAFARPTQRQKQLPNLNRTGRQASKFAQQKQSKPFPFTNIATPSSLTPTSNGSSETGLVRLQVNELAASNLQVVERFPPFEHAETVGDQSDTEHVCSAALDMTESMGTIIRPADVATETSMIQNESTDSSTLDAVKKDEQLGGCGDQGNSKDMPDGDPASLKESTNYFQFRTNAAKRQISLEVMISKTLRNIGIEEGNFVFEGDDKTPVIISEPATPMNLPDAGCNTSSITTSATLDSSNFSTQNELALENTDADQQSIYFHGVQRSDFMNSCRGASRHRQISFSESALNSDIGSKFNQYISNEMENNQLGVLRLTEILFDYKRKVEYLQRKLDLIRSNQSRCIKCPRCSYEFSGSQPDTELLAEEFNMFGGHTSNTDDKADDSDNADFHSMRRGSHN